MPTLSYNWLGIAALVVLWVNTLLIVFAAWIERSDLVSWKRLLLSRDATGEPRLRQQQLDGIVAIHRVRQIGRAVVGKQRTIAFHDAQHEGVVYPDGPPGTDVEVWPGGAHQASAGPKDPSFDEMYARAKAFRGFERNLVFELGNGQKVWVLAASEPEQGTSSQGEPRTIAYDQQRQAPGTRPALISGVEPLGLVSKKLREVDVFIIASLVACAGVTYLCLVPPVFGGSISKLGGVLGLAYFLAIQPLAVAVRNRVRLPSRAAVRGFLREPTH